MLQLVCALSQACHVVSCEVVCCRCLLLLLRRCCRCCCCLMLPAVVLPRLLLLSTAAACFRCCFFLFFFQICPKCSQNGPATQPQLSATQLQLSRVAPILFKRLSCTFRGLSCTPQLTATQSLPTFKKHYKTRATQRNSLQLTKPNNQRKKEAELQSMACPIPLFPSAPPSDLTPQVNT